VSDFTREEVQAIEAEPRKQHGFNTWNCYRCGASGVARVGQDGDMALAEHRCSPRRLHLPPEMTAAEERARRMELDSARRWVDGEIETRVRTIGRGAWPLDFRAEELTPLLLLSEWLAKR
jgi:hypothetical protein